MEHTDLVHGRSSVHVTSYLPIAKPTKYNNPRLLDDPVVRDVASQLHKTPAQVQIFQAARQYPVHSDAV